MVKWVGLGYEDNTYESEETVFSLEGGPKSVELYHTQIDEIERREELIQKRNTKRSDVTYFKESDSTRTRKSKKKVIDLIQDEMEEEKKETEEEKNSEQATFRTVYKQQPEFLSGDLFSFQMTGLNFLHSAWELGRNVILGDEMGLGKTYVII